MEYPKYFVVDIVSLYINIRVKISKNRKENFGINNRVEYIIRGKTIIKK